MSEIDYAARVQRGAALLDEKWPTWAQDIDLDTLDIESGMACMTAQYAQKHDLGAYWWSAIEPLGLADEDEDYEAHGFNADRTEQDYGSASENAYSTLNRLWRDLILQRREEAQPPEASER